jgi:hypothetical protein
MFLLSHPHVVISFSVTGSDWQCVRALCCRSVSYIADDQARENEVHNLVGFSLYWKHVSILWPINTYVLLPSFSSYNLISVIIYCLKYTFFTRDFLKLYRNNKITSTIFPSWTLTWRLLFLNVAPCSLVEIDRRFRWTYCLHHRPDDGGYKYFWNSCEFLRYYTAQHSRRQSSSYSPPWEPEMSESYFMFYLSVKLICFMHVF